MATLARPAVSATAALLSTNSCFPTMLPGLACLQTNKRNVFICSEVYVRPIEQSKSTQPFWLRIGYLFLRRFCLRPWKPLMLTPWLVCFWSLARFRLACGMCSQFA